MPVDRAVAAASAAACAHCGAELAAGQSRFCCHGCEAAAGLVAGLGLDDFYRRRLAAPGTLRPDGAAADVSVYVAERDGVCRLDLLLDGVVCGACVWLVESALARSPEVRRARVNFSTRRLALEWAGPRALVGELVGRLAALGFRVAPFDAAQESDDQVRQERELLRAMAVAGFAAANVMLLSVSVWSGHAGSMGPATREFLHWVSGLIALPAIAFAGVPFFRSALAALRAGRTNMDVPISIGVILASAMSIHETAAGREHAFFDSAVTLLFFLLIGRYLDLRARGRARQAARHVLALTARAVRVVAADGSVALRRPDAVKVGDVVLVASGERIPVDGRVIDGQSTIDQSIVTGESMPLAATRDTRLFAGSLNLGAPIRVVTDGAGEGTLLAEIARLMEAAEHGQSRYVALADRVARYYAPVVHVAGALTFVAWYFLLDAAVEVALLNAAAVLIITCPCALALAVPVVQVVVSGRLMRAGILLKSGTALERLAAVDTIVLDKTGTLTVGRPELRGVEPRGLSEAGALAIAAALAQTSRHPLSRAIVRAAPPVAAASEVDETPGAGLTGRCAGTRWRLGSAAFCAIDAQAGATAEIGALDLFLADEGGARGARFRLADRLRVDAADVVGTLQRRGYDVRLLSGDRAANVAAAAAAVGIAKWQAEATPAAKAAVLAQLAGEGRRVAMIGDGLNDAPALAAAHASLSPASAVDIAQTAADVVFQGERLGPVPETLALAIAARRAARENLILALGYNLLAVPLAMAGMVTPLIAAVAMSSSSILVIGNAMRLARGRM
ncbi:MAG: cadmium-translocating P-type ATPase [Alphaproteobacteria bacterium]|nr:cadmium-translocating P-type ATPase [Alphaproteobacteria bacterium]